MKRTPIQVNVQIVVLSALMFLIGGCFTVGRDYMPPDMKPPSGWTAMREPLPANTPEKPESLSRWWTCLDDPALSGLIARAIDQNPDMKESMARIREARARRGLNRADGFPTIDMTASQTSSLTGSSGGVSSSRELYTAGFDGSWEIDLFGGVRRSVEAATADLDAAVYSHRDVMVTLVSEVALNYLDVRVLQARLSTAEKSMSKQIELYDLALAKYRAGATDALDAGQAKTNLEISRAAIPTLKTGLVQAKNRIAVLLGEFPGTLDKCLEPPKPMPAVPSDIAVKIPAEVLRQRPDVRAAERTLASQTAKIGVARANRYPRLSLVGSIGLEALSAGELFSNNAYTDSFSPRLSWRIFDANALKFTEQAQEAVADQAYWQYRKTVLTALEEVENALTAFAKEHQRLTFFTTAGQAASETLDLALARYTAGLSDFQTVLEAQKSLLSIEDQTLESHGSEVSDLIRLYKALGGGWESSETIRTSQ